MFVLICHGNGKYDGFYVAMDGMEHSYTNNLRFAKRFPTREAASNNKCGNESVDTLENQLLG